MMRMISAKALFTGFILLIFTQSTQAQMTIAAARNLGVNNTVTVKGIVTADSTLYPANGVTLYFQDNTAGLSAYNAGTLLSNVRQGDSIEITGELSQFNQLLQISPVSSVTILNSGNPLPTPINVSLTNGWVAQYECMLVQTNGVTINASGTFSGNTNYNITDGTNSREIRINTLTPIVGTPVPGSLVNITGIMSRFIGTYQLLPRYLSDISAGAGPQIMSDIFQDNITTSSFDLSFETQDPGTTIFYYGTNALMNQPPIINTNLTTNHSESLIGLQSGRFYYVRAASVDAQGDTSFSAMRVFSTQSLSSGEMKAYFITEPDTSVARFGNAVHTGMSIIDTLIALIDNAQNTVDVAIYNWNHNNIPDLGSALNAAASRGVRVRFITDASTATLGMNTLSSSVPTLQSPIGAAYGIMHNKFVVIDAESGDPNRPLIWTGSTNFTLGQLTTDPNNVVVIQDQALARAFQLEFQEMWGSSGSLPNSMNSKFGPDKSDNTPHLFNVAGKRVELYFSPTDNVEANIINAIESADQDIEVATMLMTRTTFANVLADKHDDGIYTAVVLNDNTTTGSAPAWTILSNNLPASRLFLNNQSYIMHHKYVIVDQSAPNSDPLVVTGSHNWSNAANQRNDENTLIIYDEVMANMFFQDWVKIFRDNGGADIINLGVETPFSGSDYTLFPNPTQGNAYLDFSGNSTVTSIQLFDLQGKMMYSHVPGNNNYHQLEIPTAQLPAGMYVLRFEVNGKSHTHRLIKQ
ncbi:MAG: T9SS type A sorting domain-containing protein [Cryomorphaceae bacterium]|nr:T9SS type A sorting domain-containing protein [Cryomorphaceae bacterium]